VRAILGRLPVTWVNIDGLGDLNTIRRVGEIFGLHRLALEDVNTSQQRPKVEEYDEHTFIVIRMPEAPDPEARFDSEQVSIFLGTNYVLTFQERVGRDCFDPVRERLRTGRGRLRQSGGDYLAYTLIDAVIDAYFPVLERIGEEVETLEDELAEDPDASLVARVHEVKRDLLTLRRVVWPMRETVNALIRDPTPHITTTTQIYLRDCYDHAITLLDIVEVYRDIASGLHDLYLSSMSTRLNEIMKVLTIIATIFIPLGFIASLYGMNFATDTSPLNMPELHWYYGYPFALALMAAVAGGLLFYFWRSGWIGGRRRRRSQRR
jgi:magnesium transporter